MDPNSQNANNEPAPVTSADFSSDLDAQAPQTPIPMPWDKPNPYAANAAAQEQLAQAQPMAVPYQQETFAPPQTSQKSYVVNLLLALLFGSFAVDRFYLGKVGTGILKLITGGGLGIWYLYDVIIAAKGSAKTKQGQPVVDIPGQQKGALIVVIIYLASIAVYFAVTFTLVSMLLSGSDPSTSEVDSSQEAENLSPVPEPEASVEEF